MSTELKYLTLISFYQLPAFKRIIFKGMGHKKFLKIARCERNFTLNFLCAFYFIVIFSEDDRLSSRSFKLILLVTLNIIYSINK
jgi:hypothetical protein